MSENHRRKRKIILTAATLALYEIVLALTLFLQVPGLPEATVTDGGYNRTLSTIGNIVEANPAYVELGFLGTHDSCTYDMKTSAKVVSPEFSTGVKLALGLAKGLAVRYSVTQNVDITSQLSFGARVLDFRIIELDGEYYNYHGLVTSKIDVYVKQVLGYLAEYEGEIVTIYLQELALVKSSVSELLDYLLGIECDGKTLADYVYYDSFERDISSLTYNDLTKNGTASGVVLLIRNTQVSEVEITPDARYYHTGRFPIWYDAGTPQESLAAIDAHVEATKNGTYAWAGQPYLLQTQLTFSFDEAKGLNYALSKGSLIKMAAQSNMQFITDDRLAGWLSVVPSFWVDYINCEGFYQRANEILLENNKALCAGLSA